MLICSGYTVKSSLHLAGSGEQCCECFISQTPLAHTLIEMFSVLPPPPRYPSQAAYNAAVANGQAAPMIETNNILTRPKGPEFQLVVGEGTVWRMAES